MPPKKAKPRKGEKDEQVRENESDDPTKKNDDEDLISEEHDSEDEPPKKKSRTQLTTPSATIKKSASTTAGSRKRTGPPCENPECTGSQPAQTLIDTGERICQTCLKRFRKEETDAENESREPDDRWRRSLRSTFIRLTAEDAAKITHCENDQCKNDKPLGKKTRNGPYVPSLKRQLRICGACSGRWTTERDLAKQQNREVTDSWKYSKVTPHQPTTVPRMPRAQRDLGSAFAPERCCNDHCEQELNERELQKKGFPGPDGPICEPCYRRFLRHRKDTPGGQEITEEWKDAQRWRPRHPSACKGCHRLDFKPDEEKCEPCRRRERVGAADRPSVRSLPESIPQTHEQLIKIAAESWTAQWGGHVHMPSLPRISPDNYWTSSHSGMMTTARSRGLPLSFNNDRHLRTHELLTIIKLDDAWQGLLPQPQLQDASRWSGLDAASLLDEAQKYGYFQGKHKRLREMQQERAKADEQRRAEPDYKEDDMPDWDGDLPKTVPVGKQHLLEFFEKYVEEPFKKLADGPTMDPSLAAAVKLIARDLEEDLQGFQTRASERLHSSHNRRMVGTGPAMENLRNTIETEGRYPTQTPGDALLCGAHALAMDLNDLRSYSTTQQRQAWFGVDPPARFTADELMRLLFRNYDPSNRSAEPSLGVPTDDYPDYLNDLNLDGLGAAGVRERRRMLSMNNLHFAQLQAIMRMLYYAGRIKGGFGLGVVTGAHFMDNGVQVPATAVLHTEPADDSRPTMWLHNERLIGAALYGEELHHWEAFTHAGHANGVVAWGMPQASGGLVPPKLRWSQHDPSDIPDKDKTADDRKKEKEAQDNARQIKKLRSSCLDCAAAFDVSCDGIPFKKDCSNCKGQNKQCSWPASVAEKPTWKSSSEYAEELKAKSGQHDPPPPQLEEIQFPDLPTSWTNPSIPEKPHVAMLFFLRASSHGGLAQFNQHFANAQATAAFYDQIFDAPNPTNLVGFDIPRGVDGARLPSHIRLYPFARHRARKVPTSTANLDDPILEDFVNYFNTITDPNTPAVQRPVEIHLVTFGIPGLAVDITAFGNSAQGFFGGLRAADRQIGSNYSKTTYVVPMVEAHVVDGLTPASLPGGGQFDPMGSNITLRANGLPPQRWGYWRHKYLQKLSLRHLITRAGVVHSTRHQNFHGNQNLPVAPTYSPQPGLAGMDEQLDRWLDAAFEDMAWRSAWLSLLTVPTATHIANRNVDRNRRMRL